VWRDRFWLTGEALSTYVRSAGLLSQTSSRLHHRGFTPRPVTY
jgi:hypothetical protein